MSVGGEEVGVFSIPEIRSCTSCRGVCDLLLGNTPNLQI